MGIYKQYKMFSQVANKRRSLRNFKVMINEVDMEEGTCFRSFLGQIKPSPGVS